MPNSIALPLTWQGEVCRPGKNETIRNSAIRTAEPLTCWMFNPSDHSVGPLTVEVEICKRKAA